MAVPEQTPYKEYTANGNTTSFALGFICESKNDLIVLVDGVEPPVATWSLIGANAVFTTAPASGKKIILQRNTAMSRTTNYQGNNNSFRPETINKDIDRVWLKLQELGVADMLLKIYVDRLHGEQKDYIDNKDQLVRNIIGDLRNYVNQQDGSLSSDINNLRTYVNQQDTGLAQSISILRNHTDQLHSEQKNYIDQQDNQRNSYFENLINGQGVSLQQLDNYYKHLLQGIANIAAEKGWLASLIVDASGKNQQEITSLLANNNLVYRGAKNNQSADISDLFESVANSLNDGDTLIVPEGNYFWDASSGTKTITKNINIDCRGTIHVKPTANAFLRFRTTDFVRGAATSYIIAVNKNDTKLNIIGTPLVNPHEYYVIIESTETSIYRAGFSQPYQKYVIADIISSDYDLRDPMPFGYDDLSKATVTFIKKQAPTKITGLKFKPTIEVANAKYLNLDYVSNVTFEDCLADVNGKASAGIVIEYSNCLNLDFIKSGINGQNKAGADSYAFTIWNSAYINYEKCFNYTSGLSNKSGRLHSGRHGRNVTIDGCLCNGVDDHWGYDYLVKNINFGQTKETYGSIGFAGGSLTVENCHSPDNLVYLRTDTPCADGTLKISGSTAKKSLLFARGHEPSITAFAPQKYWDVVDIDVGVVDFTKSTEPTIIFKEPNVAQTDVYRDTILYIRNATRILNKVAGKSLLNIWMQDKADYTGEIPAFEGDYEKKRMFSKVFIENIDTTIIDDASVTSRQYLIQAPVCRELNVRDANDLSFVNVRCPVFNIHSVKTGDSKSGGGSHSLDVSELNATNVREQAGAKTWWFREVLYTTPKVYFYTSRFATRDGFISKFGNRLQASVGMVFDDVSVSANTTSDYRSRNNFVRNMTAKYTFTEAVTLAANENSVEFEVDFPTVQRADIVLAEFDLWNEYIHIDVYKKNTNGKVYFRLKNNHPTLSKVVDEGRSINFIIY